MTHPPGWYDQQYGSSSDLATSELNSYMVMRQTMLRGMMDSLGRGQPVMGQGQTPQMLQGTAPPGSDDELMGQAAFWGIPHEQAAMMPRDQLAQFIQQKRTQISMPEQSIASGIFGNPTQRAVMGAGFALGAGDSIIHGLEHIPFIGSYIKDLSAVKNADQWLHKLEEGVQMSAQFQGVNEKPAEYAGALAAMWFPAIGSWKLAGMAGKVLPLAGRVTSPILRAAAQGAGAGWIMEGGSDNPVAGIVSGAALGALGPAAMKYAPSLAAAAGRVVKAFGGKWEAATAPIGMELPGAAVQAPSAMPANVFTTADPAVHQIETLIASGQLSGDELVNAQTMLEALRPKTNVSPQAGDFVPAPQELPPAVREQIINDPSLTIEQKVQQLSSPFPEVGQGRGADNLPRRGYVPEQSPFAPEVGLRPERRPFGLPEVGLNRGPNNLPSRGFGTNDLNVEDASAAVAQMNKQGAIINSPGLPEAVAAPEINETTAVLASHAGNPGGINLTQGISDPHAVIEQLMPRSTEGSGPAFWRFVQRVRPATMKPMQGAHPQSGRLDLLSSDQPITDTMAAQYEKFGMYEGQTVLHTGGQEMTVIAPGEQFSMVKPTYGDVRPFPVHNARLSPTTSGAGVSEADGLWDVFQSFANDRQAEVTRAMGGQISPEQLAQVRLSNTQKWMTDFIESIGVTAPGEEARIKQMFNMKFVEEASAIHPESAQLQRDVAERSAMASSQAPAPTPTAALDDVAATKGYAVVPVGADGTWKVIDLSGIPLGGPQPPVQVTFSSVEGAAEFVNGIDRKLPDITPPTDIPAEVAQALPRTSVVDPQLPNEQFEDRAAASAHDVVDTIEAGSPETPGVGRDIRTQIETARASGNWGRIQQAWEYAWGKMQPARSRFLTMDRKLSEAGLGNIKVFDDWNGVTEALAKKHNWEMPWHDRWAKITDQFGAKELRDGTVTRVYEIEDPALRAQKAQEAGFGPAKVKAIEDMHQFFRDIFPETGLDPAREVARYISHVKSRQSMGFGEKAYEGFDMNPVVQPFYEMMRAGNMTAREMDARALGTLYVRAIGFEKHMAQPWGDAYKKWDAIGKAIPELEPLSNIFLNWAKQVRTGYVPGSDMMLETMHGALNMLAPGITKDQARQIFNGGLSLTHSSLLGFRPDVMARDSIQLLLAAPRLGADNLVGTLAKYVRAGAEEKAAVWQRAIDNGWVQVSRPRIASPGMFEQGMLPTAEGAASLSSPGKRLELMQALGDALHDFTPPGLRHIQNTPLHPLYFYSKQGERMRLFVGEAGYQKATSALAEYRAAGANADFGKLMGDSMARTFEPAVGRHFTDLVTAGQDTEAASFMARQIADATQFRYGTIENPEVARGTFGRVAMQMGNFSTQFYQFVKESTRYGTMGDKAKFWSTMGAVTLALKGAKEATGWNFDKWQFYNSLTFTGGPWLQAINDIRQGASALAQGASGYDSPTLESQARGINYGMKEIFNLINPLGGVVRDYQGVRAAMESPDTPQALGRLFITGERGMNVGIDNILNNNRGLQGQLPQAPPISSMQPSPSPVRGNGVGIPIPMPDSETLANQYGATNPANVYQKNGGLVYDTQNRTPDGMVPTHALDQAARVLQPGQTWEQREAYAIQSHGPLRPPSTDLSLLQPEMVGRVQYLQQLAQQAGIKLEIGEAFRSQNRQDALFAQGRDNQGGMPVTWTLTSPHTIGKAVDMIVNGDTTGRDPGYQWLWNAAKSVGLVPFGPVDPGHLAGTDSSFQAVPQTRGQNGVGTPAYGRNPNDNGGGGAFF